MITDPATIRAKAEAVIATVKQALQAELREGETLHDGMNGLQAMDDSTGTAHWDVRLSYAPAYHSWNGEGHGDFIRLSVEGRRRATFRLLKDGTFNTQQIVAATVSGAQQSRAMREQGQANRSARDIAIAAFTAVCERHGFGCKRNEWASSGVCCEAKNDTLYATLQADTHLAGLSSEPAPAWVPMGEHAILMYSGLTLEQLDELLTALEERAP